MLDQFSQISLLHSGQKSEKRANFIGTVYYPTLLHQAITFQIVLAISMGKMICADRYFPRTNQKFLKIVSVILQSI